LAGFLKEGNYTKTYNTFLAECEHLQEYQLLLKRGFHYSTSIMGFSLTDMLEEFVRIRKQREQGKVYFSYYKVVVMKSLPFSKCMTAILYVMY
jgi:hypothetical protein